MGLDRRTVTACCRNITRADFGDRALVNWLVFAAGNQGNRGVSGTLRVVVLRCKSPGNFQQPLNRILAITQYYRLMYLHIALVEWYQPVVFYQEGAVGRT